MRLLPPGRCGNARSDSDVTERKPDGLAGPKSTVSRKNRAASLCVCPGRCAVCLGIWLTADGCQKAHQVSLNPLKWVRRLSIRTHQSG